MINKQRKKFKIEQKVLNNYIEAVNSINEPMNKIKEFLTQTSKSMLDSKRFPVDLKEKITSIKTMVKTVETFEHNFPKEQKAIYFETIEQIMQVNGGILTTRLIEPLNINRQYLSIMESDGLIEKISRGIYLSVNAFEDSYFSFQQKYKKAIFSHMTALYFFEMTEEFPYHYTVTVPQRYHVEAVNDKCNVFYASDAMYEMGLTEIKTPAGNRVRVYDKERCICDIVKSMGRMDPEQVNKTIRQYSNSRDKNLAKLSEYSKKMGISDKVMTLVRDAYYG